MVIRVRKATHYIKCRLRKINRKKNIFDVKYLSRLGACLAARGLFLMRSARRSNVASKIEYHTEKYFYIIHINKRILRMGKLLKMGAEN